MDRYEIVSRLGSGGMAVVYKAVDIDLNRMVTVKILQEELATNQKFVHRFRKEAQAVASLSHPHIVSVYDVGVWEGYHYLIMEYIDGRTLKDVIKSKGHLSVQESLEFTYQILSGLRHAHSYGVIHRDIKPQNIMITSTNQVKIMDFGLALNLSDSTITYDNSVMGSVYYIAPETVQKGSGDARADIYATGIVLYEMLTGELPFTGESPIAIALQHVEGDYDSVDDINDAVPFEVARLVDKAMEADPTERYHSANLMMRDIEIAAEENDITLLAVATKDFNGSAPVTPIKAQRNPVSEKPPLRGYDEEEELMAKPRQQQKRSNSSKSSAKSSSKQRQQSSGKGKKIAIITVAVLLVLAIGTFAGIRLFAGTEEIAVPNVEGHPVDEAVQMLEDLKLEANIVPTPSADVEVDIVITQSIKEGQKVKKGRVIDLAVSTGTEQVKVPDVVNETKANAQETLEEMDFKVEFKEDFSDSIEEGRVIAQDPKEGVEAAKGSTVTLTISKGKEKKDVEVPPVVGLTLEDAKNLITSTGLKVGTVTEKNDSSVAKGYISYQSINAGTKVKEETTVDLTVSKGAESKNYTVNYTVPGSYGAGVRVVVELEDGNGTSIKYDASHDGGDRVSVSFQVVPPGTVTISIDGDVVSTESV